MKRDARAGAILLAGCGLWLLLWGISRPSGVSEPRQGLVVEENRPGSTTDKAGLLPGDVVESWAAEGGGSGLLRSPFDLVQVFLEQVPRGPVTLKGVRGSRPRSWILPGRSPSAAFRDVQVRPIFSGAALALYLQGKKRIAAGESDKGIELLQQAERARAGGEEAVSLWLSVKTARALAAAERTDEANLLYHRIILPLESQGSPIAAQLLREWGNHFVELRTWDLAKDCYRRALTVDRRVAGKSLASATSLIGLGRVTGFDGSEPHDPFFEQALQIQDELAPDSSEVAATWGSWGQVAYGNWDLVTDRLGRAVKIQEESTPGSLYLAERLMAWGGAEVFAEHLDEAERLFRRTLALTRRQAPEDRVRAGALQGLGNCATKRGELEEAEDWLHQAAALGEKISPREIKQADLLHDLGLVERRLGKPEAAARSLCQAFDIVEWQRARFKDVQEIRSEWGFVFPEEARDCADGLASIGRPQEAFEVLERGRARSFLDLLAERELRVADLPPEQAALWRGLNADYDAVEEQKRRSRGAVLTWSLNGRLREIQRRKDRLLAETLSPAVLRYPEPFGLEEARRALDPGTALVVFSTAENRTLLFTLAAPGAPGGGFALRPLKVTAEELEKKVQIFRQTILGDRQNDAELRAQGSALYDLLLRPAEPALAATQRILLVPDGPLHLLPFTALVRNGSYLIEWKPVHLALSATAYGAIRAKRRPAGSPADRQLVVFGDPAVVDLDLAPLPGSRQEARSVAAFFPKSRVFLGAEATEERLQEAGPEARLLHFAVHGVLDPEMPSGSALVLAPGSAGENGLLQAWEVMEDLRLDADLVTLSACDTASGVEISGEGLIGLTRAFQHAGARSVVGTFWEIDDGSTIELMEGFYRRLRQGASTDQALQQSQIEQIRGGRPPFSWASFQLYGDWR